MLIMTEATIANRGILQTKSLPRKFLGRVQIIPRGAGLRLWLRLLLEMEFLRFIVPLLPFALVPLFSRDWAMPVMQAPLVMVIVVAWVELRVMRPTRAARANGVSADEAARRLDTLAFRARAILRALAARHDLTEGQLQLVIEQSDLGRVPPLTLVSVQTDVPQPHLLVLDADDRAALAALFDADLTERDLLAVNHRENLYLRSITQEARAVSAHARLAALLDKRKAAS
ncbi:hypothetical protein EI545_03145 [Tabrizicola piscis]|uniref:Uncharacterized protein n=1 Tax=Tabrizicola piscis TaxID=2494374 RepID=A0A3S8U2V9_9RHOB|nr:hypothetical protein [Tabrizicola piscis]AZL57917.1 hypothetical protein EI545_03145 [Tabrizicola piscis]